MAPRNDRVFWTAEEDAHLRVQAEAKVSVTKIARQWPKHFAPRSVPALNMRKAALGLTHLPPVADPLEVTQDIQSVKVEQDGDTLSVTTNGLEVRTLDELIARAKVDMSVWEVDKPQTRMWEVKVKDNDGRIVNRQNFYISASFKRKVGPSAVEQVEAMVAGAFLQRKPVQKAKVKVQKGLQKDTMQAIVIADPHIAKHAWSRETGHGDYDIPISVKLLREAATEQITYGNAHGIGKRYLFLLGDVLHYDTPNGSTTGGTPLERDGRVEKMLEEATRALFDIIEHSAQTHPTEVVMVGGNHDALLSVALRHILFAYFRNDKRVSIEMGATTRKYLTWGKCLIGLTHGDKAQKSLGELMAVEARKEWGDALLRDIHHGHRHSEAMVTTKGGVTIRQHPALCPPDGWHAAEGYVGAPRGLDSYFYHKDGYLRGTLRSAVLDG